MTAAGPEVRRDQAVVGGPSFLKDVPLPVGIGIAAVGGALLTILGGFLSWVSTPLGSLSAWDLDLIGLLTFQDDFAGGLPAGLVMLAPLGLVSPYATRRELPKRFSLIVGAVVAGVSLVAIIRILGVGAGVSIGFGLVLCAIGGGLILFDALKDRARQRAAGATIPPQQTPRYSPPPAGPPAYSPPPVQSYRPPPAGPPPAQSYPPPQPPPVVPAAPPPAPAGAQPRFCSNCGQPAKGRFCANCGAPLD